MCPMVRMVLLSRAPVGSGAHLIVVVVAVTCALWAAFWRRSLLVVRLPERLSFSFCVPLKAFVFE